MNTFTQKRIYLDNASSTPLEPSVLTYLRDILDTHYGNPSGVHTEGLEAKKILENSRKLIAESIDAHTDEIIFTSGGTEADNLAIVGVVAAYKEKHKDIPHIITTVIEHAAVLEPIKFLEKRKEVEVTYIPVDPDGLLDISELKKSFRENTILVSVIHGNNEIGTIQDIREVAKTIRHFKKHIVSNDSSWPYPLFHIDACQSFVYLPMRVQSLGVDLMTINASKIYGPKGVGALYKKRNIPFLSLMHGGNQEMHFRPGTENVSLIGAFAQAVVFNEKNKALYGAQTLELRDYFISELKRNFNIHLHGSTTSRLPNNINVSFIGYQSEQIVIYLDAHGISVSEKSACKSDSGEISHVIKALYDQNEDMWKWGSIRFSLGKYTSKEDLDFVIEALKKIFTLLPKHG